MKVAMIDLGAYTSGSVARTAMALIDHTKHRQKEAD